MVTASDEERSRAIGRLKAKIGFKIHATAYLVVNVLMIAIWAMTDFGGYIWPIWPMFGWGIGLALHGWAIYRIPGISEEDIEAEIARGRARGAS